MWQWFSRNKQLDQLSTEARSLRSRVEAYERESRSIPTEAGSNSGPSGARAANTENRNPECQAETAGLANKLPAVVEDHDLVVAPAEQQRALQHQAPERIFIPGSGVESTLPLCASCLTILETC